MSEKATLEFVDITLEMKSSIKLISFYLDDHCGLSPDAIDYGHVGSLRHFSNLLREVQRGLLELSEL
jgi:hypothetical protein